MHPAEYTHPNEHDRKAPLLMLVLAGPLAFLLNLQTSYALVDFVCAGRADPVLLHLTPLGYIAVTAIALLISYRIPLIGAETVPLVPKLERRQFMRTSAIGLNWLFVVVLLMQWAATFFIDPCAK
jgi:hypothetical protein